MSDATSELQVIYILALPKMQCLSILKNFALVCSTAARIERHFTMTLLGSSRIIFWLNVGCHEAGRFHNIAG
jgi:hypothetical protein